MSKRKKNSWKGIDRELRFMQAEKRMQHLKDSEMKNIPKEYLVPVFKDRVDKMSMIRILCENNVPSTRSINEWSHKFADEGPVQGKYSIVQNGRTTFEFNPYIYLIAIKKNPDEVANAYWQDLVNRGEV